MFGSKKGSDYSQVNLDDFSDNSSNDGDDFVRSSIRNQQELMKKQDEGLDMLSESVARLGEHAMGISDELGQQNQMLDAMETDLDTASEELDLVTRKTNELIRSAGGKKNCILIASLCLVALVLFFLLLYV
ncbi:unnamed protein product [Cylindrotheca closterium]|uniref:t-SNARE coiled-coil homology domain-containing protein n=1 Tax=Cylindrotheca closterium TaxID=2856 RepID=A0AAD2JL93_9STRA|nr:unnamed protein product [Cylindrotheca closterium]